MEITYYVQDGYCNPGPQHCEVDDEEIRLCESEDDAQKLIEYAIEEHFRENISWGYDFDDIQSEVAELIERGKEDGEE